MKFKHDAMKNKYIMGVTKFKQSTVSFWCLLLL